MNTVIKRDGRRVPFDRQKIQNAINGAFQDVKQQDCMDNSILARVMKYIDVYNVTDKAIAVEKIQDIVERVLMEEGYYNVAKAYIRYRYEHELERQKKKQEDFDKTISFSGTGRMKKLNHCSRLWLKKTTGMPLPMPITVHALP